MFDYWIFGLDIGTYISLAMLLLLIASFSYLINKDEFVKKHNNTTKKKSSVRKRRGK